LESILIFIILSCSQFLSLALSVEELFESDLTKIPLYSNVSGEKPVMKCLVLNRSSMECRWFVRNNMSYSLRWTQLYSDCTTRNREPRGKCNHSVGNTCTWRGHEVFRMGNYCLSLTDTRTNRSLYYVFNNHDKVLPDPVKNLKIHDVTSNSMFLNWSASSDTDFLYRINISLTNPRTNREMELNLNQTRKTNDSFVRIDNLKPATSYSFSVECMWRRGKWAGWILAFLEHGSACRRENFG
jgi:hypothetical protein